MDPRNSREGAYSESDDFKAGEGSSFLQKRILLIEDEVGVAQLVQGYFLQQGYLAECAYTLAQAADLMQSFAPDVVVADVMLPDGVVIDWIEENYFHDTAQFILLTGSSDDTLFLRAKSINIDTYLLKPVRFKELNLAVKYVLANYSRKEFTEVFFGLVGDSEIMKDMYLRISRIAYSDSNVLISGETGSGKELVARALHKSGNRSEHPFLAVNCGSLSDSLLQSELFGHIKGAYTGTVGDKTGLLGAAGEGTLFLDEIEAASPLIQAALLRVLEQKEYIPVGSTVPKTFRGRIVISSNADLVSMCQEGKFRKDLYYRMTSSVIQVPPLRYRREDIPLLVDTFISELRERTNFSRIHFSTYAKNVLSTYEWPGNVRQLKNIVERCVFETVDGVVKSGLVRKILFNDQYTPSETLRSIEKKRVQEALSASRNNKSEAARMLGVSRGTLYSLIEKHSL